MELIEGGEYDGKPTTFSQFYNLTLNKGSNLLKLLEGWRGRAFSAEEFKGFELKNILGKPCFLNIVFDEEKEKTIVSAATPLPKGFVAPQGVNPLVYFSIEDFDNAVFQNISEGIAKMIVKSPEFKAKMQETTYTPAAGGPDGQESAPF